MDFSCNSSLNGSPRKLNGSPRQLNGGPRKLNGGLRKLNGGLRKHTPRSPSFTYICRHVNKQMSNKIINEMKKVIVILALALMANFANAQKMNSKDVPASVTASFIKLYPAIKEPKWEKEGGNFEANFDLNKVETSVTFDASGNMMDVESEINVSALPQAVLDYMKKTYPDKKIKEASKITDAKGVITYEAECKGLEVIFDAKGGFLKEVKQVAKEKKD